MEKKKPHYAWAILAACCLIQGGIGGLGQNSRGVFFHPVCSDLGFDTSVFTAYSIFQGIASFLFVPVFTRLLKERSHRLVLGLSIVLYTGATALMGSMSRLPGFYAAAFVQGIGASLLNVYLCPLLIANWFEKFYGLAMGIYAAFSGIVAIFVNPLLDSIITNLGWRNGYRLQGLMGFLITIPSVLLIKAIAPEDCGLCRYGESGIRADTRDVENAPVTAKERRLLVLMMVFTFASGLYNAASQHLSNYAASLGIASATGALFVSCAMVGNIGGKVVSGLIHDRFGAKASIFFTYISVAIGLLLLTAGNSPLLYPGSVLVGLAMPIGTVCVPMAAKYIYGLDRYRRFYAAISMMNVLVVCFSVTLLGALYDLFGNYPAVFLAGFFTIPVCLGLLEAADRLRKKDGF